MAPSPPKGANGSPDQEVEARRFGSTSSQLYCGLVLPASWMYSLRSTIHPAGPYCHVWEAPVMNASYWSLPEERAAPTLSKYTSSGKTS